MGAAAAGMSAETILLFIGAAAILFLTPGPNMMFAVACGLAGGPRAGIAAGLGAATGIVVHTGFAAVGLTALLAASPSLFGALRWIGAAYLLWLAVAAWRAGDALEGRLGRDTPRRAFRRALLTSLLNPKLAFFMIAFLPQFVSPEAGPAWAQFVILGAILAPLAAMFDCSYGAFAGAAADRIRRASKALNRISALIFGGLAARLALS